jgi:hypothetical protein
LKMDTRKSFIPTITRGVIKLATIHAVEKRVARMTQRVRPDDRLRNMRGYGRQRQNPDIASLIRAKLTECCAGRDRRAERARRAPCWQGYLLKDTTDVVALERFIAQFPDSPLRKDAEKTVRRVHR